VKAVQVKNPAAPGSREWLQLVSASKIPVILGISRYQSQYTLWHEMAGLVESKAAAAATQDDWDYGHAAELAAAEYWKYKTPPTWRLSRVEVQYTRPDLPYGNAATIDRRASCGQLRRVVEIKTARDLAEWGDDGSGIVPADYAAQVIWQQFITGWHDDADIVLWPQYGKPKIYHVVYDLQVAQALDEAAYRWMHSLKTLVAPPLDDSVSCYETVKALHPDIDGSTAELDPKLAAEFLATSTDLKALKSKQRLAATKVLDAMGNAQYAQVNGVKIADRRPNKYGITLMPNYKITTNEIQGANAA